MTLAQRRAVALCLPFGAAALQWLLWPWLRPFAWLLFTPAVFVGAVLAGRWGAAVAAMTSVLLVVALFRGPEVGVLALWLSGGVFVGLAWAFGEMQARGRLQLHRTNASLAAIVESSDDAIVAKSLDGVITSWNAGAERLFGYPAAEAVGRSIALIVPPDRLGEESEIIARLRRGEYIEHLETTRRHRDGRLIEVSATISPIRDEAGRVVGASKIARDITARRRMEAELDAQRRELEDTVQRRTAELRARERFLQTVTDALPVMVSYWNREGRCEFANAAYAGWAGLPRERMHGLRLDEIPGEPVDGAAAEALAAAKAGRAASYELALADRHGAVRHHWTDCVPDTQHGVVQGLVVVRSDVTLLKGAELRTRQANTSLSLARDAADAANRAKSEFLANMSHEIRTPMNAVLGLTRLVQRDTLTATQRERVGKIGEAALQLLTLLNDILDLSKIEAGRLQLERVNFPIASVLDQVLSLVADAAAAKGLLVTLDTGDVPAWLEGDPTRLRQALLNYAANAVKFTAQGRIDIAARVLRRDAQRLLVRFEVRDTGIGIDPAALPRLFAAFEQADASTTRRFGGTGLGLAVTRRLASMMGGEAGAESRPDSGSTFWFTAELGLGRIGAPIAAPSEGPGQPEARLRERHAGARVLLAEDHPVNREIAVALLEGVGLRVDVAVDGLQAVELAATGQHDLLLMDMQMPQLDGLDATRAIRRLPDGARVPIIAMTANAFDDDRLKCLAAGMNDFVAKPVEPDHLFATLLRWLPEAAAGAARTAPPDLRQRLLALDTLDGARCLELMRDDIRRCARLLHRAADVHADDAALLRRAAATADPSIGEIVHRVKGGVGTLGARACLDAVAAVEAALRDGGPASGVARPALQLADTLDRLAESIHVALAR